MQAVLDLVRATADQRVAELDAWLRIPSISSLTEHAADMERCAAWTARYLEQAGLEEVQIHPTARHPIITGQWLHAPGRPTLLIYGHYDVQPVDPVELWITGPFEPDVRHGRIHARGSADDKGQILMHMQAVAATLAATGRLPINVIFLIEGEEEIGSPNLPDFLHRLGQTGPRIDLAMVSDTCMWAEGIPAITAGLRGLVALDVEVIGPSRDLHSGSFGGAVANPVEILARMLATLKDEQGTIQVAGLLAEVRPPTPEERARVAEIFFDADGFLGGIGVGQGWGEAGYSLLERLWYRPTIEINGLWGGYTGAGAKTVLPARAYAKLSMRLVPDQRPERVAAQVAAHLQSVAPSCVRVEVRTVPGGGHPWRLNPDLPAVAAMQRALHDSFGHPPVLIGEGASIPVVADLDRILGIPTLLVGFSLPDACPHSPNENFHLASFHTGTESLVRFFHDWAA
ncbi:MAG: dipeptidase [Magnetococcales bacterium]|nr:dipeptidase [Magnetococcales bacterium]NGZ05410.1 dipeptidase [Magnetococcales bacterium]